MAAPVKKTPSRRREQADASRRTVLAAAREAFIEQGYHGATMADIAQRSGFAVQTVSYFFGTKPRLMSQLIRTSIEDALAEAGAEDPEQWMGITRATTAQELVDSFVAAGHDILVAVAPLMDVARVGSLTDPEVAEVYEFHEAWRRRDYTAVVEALQALGGLREGLTIEDAIDITLTLFGPDVYRALLVDQAWSPGALRDWTRDALVRQLLG
ncbi:MAG: helix-turn-helix domain-containing protein [Propionibacteriaceae bacterium]|nr:helix-turn-helix domain-containing protein [Propionibacteriaceae bacterium]